MKKSINIYWAIRLACKKTGLTVKKFLSISCFSFQLTLITVLWLERVNYFCLLKKTIYFSYLLSQIQNRTNRPFILLPLWHNMWICQSGVQKHDLLRAWGKKRAVHAGSPLEGIAQSQLTETMFVQQGVAGESH